MGEERRRYGFLADALVREVVAQLVDDGVTQVQEVRQRSEQLRQRKHVLRRSEQANRPS